jgi:hypothetical protein
LYRVTAQGVTFDALATELDLVRLCPTCADWLDQCALSSL